MATIIDRVEPGAETMPAPEAAAARQPASARTSIGHALRHHGLVLAAYALLAVALTWPLARDFSTRMLGQIFFDMRHALSLLWYQREVFFGRASWPATTLFYYPHGINTLVDGVGPVNALLALPFWPLGATAAFNGAVLTGLTLSSWSLYLLARYVRLSVPAALFAGALFMAWPIHLVALHGHLEKLFEGLLPLTVLAALLAFDLRRQWTIFLPGLALLATLFQNANQFTFAVLALAVLGLFQMAAAPRGERLAQTARLALVAVLAGAICLPALHTFARVVRDPLMDVSLGWASWFYMPDLLQFLVPSPHQALTAGWIYPHQTMEFGRSNTAVVPWLVQAPDWYGSGVETAVNVPITAIALSLVAWVRLRRQRDARRELCRWLMLGVVCAMAAMGPILRVAGVTPVTASGSKVPMPEALLLALPGFEVMRTPGRYMMMGSVAFALVAGFGLMAISRRRGYAAAVAALALIECWPSPWPQHVLPPVPDFYRRIVAADRDAYGVLDLPAGILSSELGSAYQYYQTIHHKPIAWGYLSRQFRRYPTEGFDSMWEPAYTDYADTRRRLARYGFRYVVWHKHASELFDRARDTGTRFALGAAAQPRSNAFLAHAFGYEQPVYEDALVTVYRVDAPR